MSLKYRWPELVSLILSYLVLEVAWFSYAVPNIYTPMFRDIQGRPTQYRMVFAPFAYVILVTALYIFVVRDAVSRRDAAMRATLLALGIYGVYNLTNLATLSMYPITGAAIDLTWGLVVFNTVAQIAYSFRGLVS